MATPTDGGPPGATGSDGGDQEAVDLRALQAQVQQNTARIDRGDQRYERLVNRLRQMAKFEENEWAQLLAE